MLKRPTHRVLGFLAGLLCLGLAAAPPRFQIDTAADGARKGDTWRVEVIGQPEGNLVIDGKGLTPQVGFLLLEGNKSYPLDFATSAGKVNVLFEMRDADGFWARYRVAKGALEFMDTTPVYTLVETNLPVLEDPGAPQPPLSPANCPPDAWQKVERLVQGVLATDFPVNGTITVLQPKLSQWHETVKLNLLLGKDPSRDKAVDLRFLRPPAPGVKFGYGLSTDADGAQEKDFWRLRLAEGIDPVGDLKVDGMPLAGHGEVILTARKHHTLDYVSSLGRVKLTLDLKDSKGRVARLKVDKGVADAMNKLPFYTIVADSGGDRNRVGEAAAKATLMLDSPIQPPGSILLFKPSFD